MMLPSYVDVLPSGHESGDCFAIDLGGTNLRVAHLRLGQGRGEVEAVNIWWDTHRPWAGRAAARSQRAACLARDSQRA
jgi:hypothetical protein